MEGKFAGRWVRPVSDRLHEEVSERERQYSDGSDPKVLDIIDIEILQPKPLGYQQENWLINPNFYWQKCGQADPDLTDWMDTPKAIWLNGYSSYNAENDRVPLVLANSIDSSLALIRVEDLSLRVFAKGEAFGDPKRCVQACFSYNRVVYQLRVTDPIFERSYLGRENGHYQIGRRFLCISLGEPFHDYCYKLVASII